MMLLLFVYYDYIDYMFLPIHPLSIVTKKEYLWWHDVCTLRAVHSYATTSLLLVLLLGSSPCFLFLVLFLLFVFFVLFVISVISVLFVIFVLFVVLLLFWSFNRSIHPSIYPSIYCSYVYPVNQTTTILFEVAAWAAPRPRCGAAGWPPPWLGARSAGRSWAGSDGAWLHGNCYRTGDWGPGDLGMGWLWFCDGRRCRMCRMNIG